MSYEIIPQEIRVIINNQYPRINDNHKNQLTELWSVLLQNGGGRDAQASLQFLAFLQQQIENVNDIQTISDRIDAEIANVEGEEGEIEDVQGAYENDGGGRMKRKSSKKYFRNSSKKRKGKSSKKRKGKSFRKYSKKRK